MGPKFVKSGKRAAFAVTHSQVTKMVDTLEIIQAMGLDAHDATFGADAAEIDEVVSAADANAASSKPVVPESDPVTPPAQPKVPYNSRVKVSGS